MISPVLFKERSGTFMGLISVLTAESETTFEIPNSRLQHYLPEKYGHTKDYT